MLYDRPKSVLRHAPIESMTYCCECDQRSKTPVNGSDDRCSCTPSSSPKKKLAHPLPSPMGTANSNGSATGANPYLNYQVPRTALANMYLKEMREKAQNHQPQVPPKTPLASEMYDIPKNFRVSFRFVFLAFAIRFPLITHAFTDSLIGFLFYTA